MEPLNATGSQLRPRAARPSLASRPGWWLSWIVVLSFAILFLVFAALQRGVNWFGEIRAGAFSVAPGTQGVAALEAEAKRWAEQTVTVHVGPYIARMTRADLGARLPVEQVSPRLMALGKSGNPFTDLGALIESHTGGYEILLRPAIARERLSERIQQVRAQLERPPVAGMLLADGRELPGIPGITINSLNAADSVEQALANNATELRLDTTTLAPPRSRNARSNVTGGDFGVTMIAVETTYRSGGGSAGRAHNIELAASAIDGTVLPPGGELSFNESVGERSYARGFATAKELANRRIVDGVGGGVCQVAATLHAAAFLSGLALPEYRPHSRPVGYIHLGLDTMVSWPNQDMRIANSYPFPIRIRARADDGVLQFRLEGSGKAHPVEWNTQIVSRVKPGVQELRDDSLAAGRREVIQEAIDGLSVRRTRTIYLPTGPHLEENMLRYPPNDRIVAVGISSRGGSGRSKYIGMLESSDF